MGIKTIQRDDLLYPELSYKLVGILFGVHNTLGYGYLEKYYQKAIAALLNHSNVKFSGSAKKVWRTKSQIPQFLQLFSGMCSAHCFFHRIHGQSAKFIYGVHLFLNTPYMYALGKTTKCSKFYQCCDLL